MDSSDSKGFNSLDYPSSVINENQTSQNNFSKEEEFKQEIEQEKDEQFKSISAYSDIDDHFFCKKCMLIPTLRFISMIKIIYSCGCQEDCEEEIDKFLENTKIHIKNKININNENPFLKLSCFFCQIHKGEKYFYYCEMCKQHLCRKCVRIDNEHKDHWILIFDQSMNEIDKKIKFINEKFYLNKPTFISDSSDFLDEDIEKELKTKGIIQLMSIIINDYNSYTNYSHFKIISNFYYFLDHLIKTKQEAVSDNDLEKQIKIINRRDLQKFFKNPGPDNNPELIIEINFQKNNLFDITELCKANLKNLKTLKLRENNISNIEPLINANFKESIQEIDFSVNKLGNENIKYLCQLDFCELYDLNLFANFFTDFNFFKINNNKKLKKLSCLYIGSNKFNDNQNDITIDASNLTEIGMSNGIFNDKSIHLINNFRFDNLEILFLYSNDISSLSFIEKLELPKIKQFWINSNFIDEYYPLCKYKTLKKVILRNNYIKDISKLESFVNNFNEDLETLDISGNNIDLNDKDNEDILLKVGQKVYEFKYY